MCADRSACRRCSASVAWSSAPPSRRDSRLPIRYRSCTSRSRPWFSTRTCGPASNRLTTRGSPKTVRKPSRRAVTRKRVPITATRYADCRSLIALPRCARSALRESAVTLIRSQARSSGGREGRVARLVDRLVELRAVQLRVAAAPAPAAPGACPARRSARPRPPGSGPRRGSWTAGARSPPRCAPSSASPSASCTAASEVESRCAVASSRIDHAGPGEQQPCDRQPLPLTARQAVPPLADHGVQPVREPGDQLLQPGPAQRRPTARPPSPRARASSRLARIDSWNRCPSWVTSPSASRIVSNDRSRTSTPPIRTAPASTS